MWPMWSTVTNSSSKASEQKIDLANIDPEKLSHTKPKRVNAD